MKREYFGMLIILGFVVLSLLVDYLFEEAIVKKYLFGFSPILILLAFQAGQYSMRFPKAF
jgi:hypothetical protein